MSVDEAESNSTGRMATEERSSDFGIALAGDRDVRGIRATATEMPAVDVSAVCG